MAYYFECDGCSFRVEFDPLDEPQFVRNCDNCGIDGCDECLLDGVCDSCADKLDDLLEEDDVDEQC